MVEESVKFLNKRKQGRTQIDNLNEISKVKNIFRKSVLLCRVILINIITRLYNPLRGTH